MFSSVAESYDVMNDLMSAGVHRWWKDELIRELKPTPSMRLLDMAGGTGDVAFRFLDALQSQYGTAASSHGLQGGGVTISDINKDMLAVGRSRYEERYGAQYGVVAGVYQSGVERPPHSAESEAGAPPSLGPHWCAPLARLGASGVAPRVEATEDPCRRDGWLKLTTVR